MIAASEVLQRSAQAQGRPAELLTHGVDLAHWRGVTRRPPRAPQERPIALYWGYADARLDVDICLAVADRCDLHIVGPRGEVHPRLLAHPGIVWRDAVGYEALPALASAADVLVMPYARLPVTEAMQPLKLKEYLATPLPVISTPLPSTAPWFDALDLAADPAPFAELCVRRAGEALPAAQLAARQRLEPESWAAKSRLFETMLGAALPATDQPCPSTSYILAS